jgi:hypothetical protein
MSLIRLENELIAIFKLPILLLVVNLQKLCVSENFAANEIEKISLIATMNCKEKISALCIFGSSVLGRQKGYHFV